MELIKPASDFDPESPQIGFYDLPEPIYRAAPGTNWSNLKRMDKTAKSYKWFLDHPEADADTPDKIIGRLFHTLALEPGLAPLRFITHPPTYKAKGKRKAGPPVDKSWNMNANDCKDWIGEAQGKGLTVVGKGDVENVTAMAQALRAIPPAQEFLVGADGYEVSIFWNDPQTGIPCKGKLDVLRNGQIADLKKVSAKGAGRAAPGQWESFSSHVWSWSLHGQAAFYRDGVNAVLHDHGIAIPDLPMFRWLMVEDKAPYDTASYTVIDHPEALSRQWLTKARETYHSLLQQVAFCAERDCWPSYNPAPSGVTEDCELIPPDWLAKRLEVSML